MDPHHALDVAVHGTELALAIAAFVSIIVTQIITTRLNSAKIKDLTNHVRLQNGTLADQARELHNMQVVCAATHGVRQAPIKTGMVPPDGDEP